MAPPFDVSSDSSNLNLVRKFTSSKGGNKGRGPGGRGRGLPSGTPPPGLTVYIYELKSKGYKDLKGSPFSSYSDGNEAIGLNRNNRVIGRYIDTGKAYKNKYL